jgi:4'-phosphopantetheinyl transferase
MTPGSAPHWRLVGRADVPHGDAWLSPPERAVDASFSRPWRRADWRLGRYAVKGLVGRLLDVSHERVSVLAAPDGAPEAYVDGRATGWSVSLSHRDGSAVAMVAAGGAAGIDLEVVEPRSEAFVEDWLHHDEQVAVSRSPDRDLAVVLRWSAKEAAAKARREGLRLDVRDAVVVPGDEHGDGTGSAWWPLAVGWRGDGRVDRGWWQHLAGFVVVAVTAPDLGPPVAA